MNFKFNEAALNRAAHQAVTKAAAAYEQLFADLTRQYRGKPLDEIRPVLRAEWKKIAGGDITDPELTEYATYISEGRPIEFSVDE